MNKDKVLQVESVIKVYSEGEYKTEALKGISFDVLDGEFLGIMGPSGSGKTTLLNCMATTLQPSSGRILLKDEDMSTFRDAALAEYRGQEIGYLFQEFELLDNLTASENITLPCSLHGVSPQKSNPELQQLAHHFDITDVLDKFPSEMSGGQRQRVAAARALIAKPSIVLADEPTGALDGENARILMDKLAMINEIQKKTIIMVTHNANAASYCSRILFIQDGRLVHELRRNGETEDREKFYDCIVHVMTQLGEGTVHVL